ncbi:MBL fold metallo-hydrolase [Kiritimatiellaeota bacterium B1221]|nr:MBL fold metallo-hydrolase [Kiritimatiellaeota bacterium B1221]
MQIQIIPTGMIQTNCIILSNQEKQALVIDPGADAGGLQETLSANGLTVIGYPFTHGHYDHVCAIGELHAACPAPCWMHPLDLSWAFTSRNQNLPWYRQPDPASVPEIQTAWEKDGTFNIGPFTFETLFLPGHSPGSVAFHFPEEKLLIGGDVLFKGSVGRTDLPGGNTAVLMNSLRRLAELPDDTRVIPGHGPATTIGTEKRSNPYMHQALC